MFGLELWFVYAVLSAIVGGLGAFSNKMAAARNYNTQLVLIANACLTILLFGIPALFFEGIQVLSWWFVAIALLSGLVTTASAYIKIQVLHYIDSAIFLPLHKVLGPSIVVIFGILFFDETFTPIEWFGLFMSLSVPLLLISRVENDRQNNLKMGLILVLVCAATSAIAAALQKYATEIQDAPLWIVTMIGLGVLVNVSVQFLIKHRSAWREQVQTHLHKGVWSVALLRTVFAGGGFFITLLAFIAGGPLGIVYTINSLYILLPIVLAIIFYGEHWNIRKAFAIVLSVVALALLQ